jgi:hypothetical protein
MSNDTFEPPAFVQHFEKMPPAVLYHYTGQVGILGIVKTAELWATKIQYMNDATEFGLALAMARKKLDSMMANSISSMEKAACVHEPWEQGPPRRSRHRVGVQNSFSELVS